MSALLLDASVWLAALDRQDRFHAEAARIVTRARPLAALDLTLYEVANVAAVKWRSATDAQRLVRLVTAACEDRLVRASGELLAEAAPLAIERGITLYDAAYVSAAAARGWVLVSADIHDLVDPGLAVSPQGVPEGPEG